MSDISRRVLLVDDELNVLRGLQRQLRREFDLTLANGGEEGLKRIEEEGPFAVVVSDYKMPQMDGIAFLRQVHLASPHTVLVMLTGQADVKLAMTALNEGGISRFLQKPCPRELLVRTLEDCLEQYRLAVAERILTAELNEANNKLRTLNEELEQHVAERTASIQRLHRFVSELNGLDSLDDVARIVVSTAADMLSSRRVSVMLPDARGEYLTIKAACGIGDEIKARVRVPVGAPIAGQVFVQSTSVVINDPSQFVGQRGRYDTELFASVPLASASMVTPGGPVGVLSVTERIDGGIYDAESLAGLRAIAEAGAIAIRNQLRLQERNDARDAIILALAKLAEHRDPETGYHLERVRIYCRLLSETLAETPKYASVIDPEFIETIFRSSPLHDIGKVGIPDRILQKPGRLTPEERKVMQRHAKIGGDTIRALIEQGRAQDFLRMGMDIAYYHHEKHDGTGYPFGLSGEEIPLAARIMAVADVYDALTTERVYKAAMSHEESMSIIHKECGSHFAPDVVAALLSREEEFARIAARGDQPVRTDSTGAPCAAGRQEQDVLVAASI